MSKNVKRHSRKFLNPASHWDTGILEWHVEQQDTSIDAYFSVWDCSKKITLSFDFYDEEGANNRAKKVNTLIQELEKFKEALAQE